MKKILAGMLAGAAVLTAEAAGAADLAPAYKSPFVPPAFSWTGCYLGAQVGLGAGHTKWTDIDVPGDIDGLGLGRTAKTDLSGQVFGGQLGCDYQFAGNWVVGIQGMGAGSDISGTNQDQFNAPWTLTNQVDWLATVTGRLGWSIDRVLLYVRGGAAWAHSKLEIENSGFTLGTPSVTRLGWTIGPGIEWAFAPGWSVFLEGDFYDFSNQSIAFVGNPGPPNAPFHVNNSQTLETLMVGVNFHFFGGR